MKCSQYNLVVATKEPGKYVVYNTLHDSILIADTELKNVLESDAADSLDEEYCTILKNMGMITEDALDEKQILSYRYHREKYSSPYAVFVIFPTLACNLACTYCYERSSELPQQTMDDETLRATISFIRERSLEDNVKTILIKLYGGEPLLQSDGCYTICKEISTWAKAYGLHVAVVLQTNGTLLSETVVNQLAPYLTYVELTVDGPQEAHDSARVYKDGSGTYNHIMDALGRTTAREIHTVLRINVKNDQDLKEVLSDLTNRGFRGNKNVQFYYAQTSDFGLCELFGNNKLCFEDENRALDMLPQLRTTIEELGWSPQLEMPDVIQKQKFVSCNNEKKARYVIDPSGDLYLCFFRAGQKEYRAGSLKDPGYFGPLYYGMLTREPLQFEECASCVYLPLCGGGCAMRAYEKEKTFQTNDCGSIKDITQKRILLYLKRRYPQKFGE
ncbi:MAG: SPASM domain-containing protein [Theionarchaea archaeon]|nr:SPASM domain-containing protein [Theionarchaea archaeon]